MICRIVRSYRIHGRVRELLKRKNKNNNNKIIIITIIIIAVPLALPPRVRDEERQSRNTLSAGGRKNQ